MNKKNAISSYEKFLYQDILNDSEFALAYLNGALSDDTYPVFLLCLHDVIEAYGGREIASQKSGIPIEKLDRILAEQDHIDQQTFAAIINTFGWSLSSHEPRIIAHPQATTNVATVDFSLLEAFNK